MPQINNDPENVKNMLKANGVVEELQKDVTKLQSDVGDRTTYDLSLTEEIKIIHQRQDGYASGSVAVPRAEKAERDGEGNNIVGTYVDNDKFDILSHDFYLFQNQLFDSETPMGDISVRAAKRDALGNEIHTTYSTKDDLLYFEGTIQVFQVEDEIIQIRDSNRIKDIRPGVYYLNQTSTEKRGIIIVPTPNDTQFFFDPDGNVYKRIKRNNKWLDWQSLGATTIEVDGPDDVIDFARRTDITPGIYYVTDNDLESNIVISINDQENGASNYLFRSTGLYQLNRDGDLISFVDYETYQANLGVLHRLHATSLSDLNSVKTHGAYELFIGSDNYILFVTGRNNNYVVGQVLVDISGIILKRSYINGVWSDWAPLASDEEGGGGEWSGDVDTAFNAFSENPLANKIITQWKQSLESGDSIVKKTEQDNLGNNIAATYLKKSDNPIKVIDCDSIDEYNNKPNDFRTVGCYQINFEHLSKFLIVTDKDTAAHHSQQYLFAEDGNILTRYHQHSSWTLWKNINSNTTFIKTVMLESPPSDEDLKNYDYGLYAIYATDIVLWGYLFVWGGDYYTHAKIQLLCDSLGNIKKRNYHGGTEQWTEWERIDNGGGSEIIVDIEVDASSDNPIANSAITQYVTETYATKEEVGDVTTVQKIEKGNHIYVSGAYINKPAGIYNENAQQVTVTIDSPNGSVSYTVSGYGGIDDITLPHTEFELTCDSSVYLEYYVGVNQEIGDISTALDEIINIQNSLLGVSE